MLATDGREGVPVDRHQEPFVVVVPVFDELLPRDVVGDGAVDPPALEAVPVEAGALLGVAEASEVVEVAAAVLDVEEGVGVMVAVLEGAAGPGPAAAAVRVPFAAYAAARCTPRPPAAMVEASSTPAVHRRVLRRAALTWRGDRLVMTLLT